MKQRLTQVKVMTFPQYFGPCELEDSSLAVLVGRSCREEVAVAVKRSSFSEPQIAFVSRQAEERMPVVEVCRKAGIKEATYYGDAQELLLHFG